MKLNDVLSVLDREYPQILQEEWDCSGLVSRGNEEVNKVLVTLDITSDVAKYAIEHEFDLIISHHPIIFGSYLETNSYLRSIYHKLNQSNISLYSMHTNFDNSSVGMNYHYIKKLGYKPSSNEGMIQIFENDGHFIDNLMKNVKNIRVYNIAPKINRIAVLLGSGGSFIEEIDALNCDVFISSEFKHHEILYAKEHDIMLIDVTHQAEGVFANVIAEFLTKYKDLEIGVYKDTYEVDILGR